jgi:hypothetical protein
MQQKPAGMREKTYSGALATTACRKDSERSVEVLKNQRKVQQQQMNQQEQKLQQEHQQQQQQQAHHHHYPTEDCDEDCDDSNKQPASQRARERDQ